MLLSACGANLAAYEKTEPRFVIEDFFNGPIKGWGIVQDWKGEVVQRFDVVMVGRWQNGVGTLEEKFTYYDGKQQERVWTIRKRADGTYEGTASDILEQAEGQSNGSAMRWKYRMDLPVGDTTYRITFDDWMFQMHDGVLINRSYLKKFGVTVAELSLFMQQQK